MGAGSSEKPNDPPKSPPQMYFSSKAPDYPSLPVAVKWLPGPCLTVLAPVLLSTSGTGSIALAVRDAIAEALKVEPNLLRLSDLFSRDLSVLPQFHNLDGSNFIPILEKRSAGLW
jgi:hypothetical protein